jgi:hypothetical protein
MGGTIKIQGVEEDFGVAGGQKYIVPPLSLGSLELLQDRLEALQKDSPTSPESIRTIIDATHAALLRNYPDLARETVANLIDVSNMHDVMASVLDIAGLKRKAIAEGKQKPAEPATPPAASST